VADDRTTILEVVEDRGDFLQIGADNSMAVRISIIHKQRREIGEENLKIEPLSPPAFETPIVDIRIPGQELPDFDFKMSELVGQETFDAFTALGVAVPLIEATGIDTTAGLPLDDVAELVVREGSITVTIDNGLPVPLAVTLTLVDRDNGDRVISVLTGLPDQIAPNGRERGEFDLAGADISGTLGIEVSGGTVEAQNVDIVGDPTLVIESSMQDLIVESARAKIPGQQLSDNQLISFPDRGILIESATIREGGLTLEITSRLPVDMTVTLQLDDLIDDSGNPVVIEDLVLPARIPDSDGEVVSERLDLNNTTFKPNKADPFNLRLSYSATTDPSDGLVEIRTDSSAISVKALTEDLKFDEVKGILDKLPLDAVDPIEQRFDNIPDGLENIKLETTTLVAWLTTKVGFQSEIELLVEGENAAGERLDFIVQQTFERYNATTDPAEGKVVNVSLDSKILTDFLNLLPNTIKVTPSITVGDGVSTETVSPTDWVQVDSVIFGSEARFKIEADDRIEVEPTFRELKDEEARTRISNNLKSATAITLIENHIPLAVRVSLWVAATKEDVFTNPLLRIPTDGTTFGIEAAPVDANGRTTSSIVSAPQLIELTKDEVLVFLQKGGVYTGVLVEFDTTVAPADAGDPTAGFVELLGSDWVNVQAATEVVLKLNESLVK
jgi:hypothetical protein